MKFQLSPLNLLYLFIAGAIGALLRFIIIEIITIMRDKNKKILPFPHHTFTVNTIACLLMGFLATRFNVGLNESHYYLKVVILIGFLGSFSTFSTYIADIFEHFKHRQYKYVIYFSFGSIIACLSADFLGRLLAKGF